MIGHGAFLYCSKTKRFLFLLRSDMGRYEHFWNLPGGKQRKNETVRQCLIREIEEETGITILTNYIPIDTYTNSNGSFTYNTYFCTVSKEFTPSLNHEHSGFCWVPLDKFPRPLHPGIFGSLKEDDTRLILGKLIELNP